MVYAVMNLDLLLIGFSFSQQFNPASTTCRARASRNAKAVEGYRTPRRWRDYLAPSKTRSVLEIAPDLWECSCYFDLQISGKKDSGTASGVRRFFATDA